MTSTGTDPRPLVFICYAGPDAAHAVALRDALVEVGLRAWCDKCDLVSGDPWDVTIGRALDAAALVVVLISEAGCEHDAWYARDEFACAIEGARMRGTRIVPIMLDPVSKSRLPAGLARLTPIDATDRDEPRVARRIATTLGHHQNAHSSSPATPPLAPTRRCGAGRAARRGADAR